MNLFKGQISNYYSEDSQKVFLHLSLLTASLLCAFAIAKMPPLIVLATFSIGSVLIATIFQWITRPLFFLIVLLGFKPIIDLTWRWHFISFDYYEGNVQGLIGLGVIVLVVIYKLIPRRHWIHGQGILLSIFIFITLSIFVNEFSVRGGVAFARFLSGAALFFIVGAVIVDNKSIKILFSLTVISVLIPMGLGLAQVADYLPYEKFDYGFTGSVVGRLTGTFSHPMDLIRLMTFTNLFALFLISVSRKSSIRKMLWCFLGFSLIIAIFTTLRGGIVVLFSQIILWFFLQKKVGTMLLTFMIIMATLLIFNNFFFELLQPLIPDSDDPNKLFRGRLGIWKLYFTGFQNLSFGNQLIGTGQDYLVLSNNYFRQDAHNDFVRIIYSYGYIGLILYCYLLSFFGWLCIKLKKKGERFKDHFNIGLANMGIIVLFSIIAFSITRMPMTSPSLTWYFFSVFSIISFRAYNSGPFDSVRLQIGKGYS